MAAGLLSSITGSIAGAGLFLGGIFLLRRSLSRLTGPRLQAFLARWAGTRWRAAAAGCLAATALQSSSLTNLLVVTMTHSRWITLPQAIAMILGANVGTTTTVQLIALSPEDGLPHVAGLALVLVLVGRGPWRQAGFALGGLVGVLAGIHLMGSGMAGLLEQTGMARWDRWFRPSPAAGLWPSLAGGTALTAIVQSSSLTIGMAMALARAGALSAAEGIAFALGANVGTVGSTLLGAAGASGPARQAAVADLLFNVLGVLAAWPFVSQLATLAAALTADPGRQIAAAHAVFNVVSAALGVVLLDGIVWLSRRAVPEGGPGRRRCL